MDSWENHVELYSFQRVGRGGERVERPCALLADNDGQALRIASEMLRDQPAEVWRGSEMIAGLTPWPTSPESKWIIVIKS